MHDTLTSAERKTLLSLRSRADIVSKPADKGSATVVMSRQDCLTKVISQNEEFYLKLDEEPMSRYAEEVACILAEMTDRQVIDKKTFKCIVPSATISLDLPVLPYPKFIRKEIWESR